MTSEIARTTGKAAATAAEICRYGRRCDRKPDVN